MTNENLAVISAIKSFKLEKEIFKTVLKNLIDKEADENIIAILLNPDLVGSIIDEHHYTEALEYVMHTYQQERREIVVDMQLKRYERKVQGAIEEAKISQVPTMEAATRAGGAVSEAEAKNAKDSAIIFIQDEKDKDKLAKKEAEIEATKTDSVDAPNIANDTAKKGQQEIKASLDPNFEEAKKAGEEFAEANGIDADKAQIKVPEVTVVPKKEEKDEEVDKKEVEEKTDEEERIIADPAVNPKEIEEKEVDVPEENKPALDDKEHEVVATRETSSFFKRHKKAILIATGIATLAITTAAFPTIIVPSIMAANSTLYNAVGIPAVKTVLHGLNTVLGKIIGATFSPAGVWTAASGAVINGAAANTCLASAIATYGLWGVYGKGVVDAVKGLCKGVDMESEKKVQEKDAPEKQKEEKPLKEAKRTEELFASIGAELEGPEMKKEEPKKEEAKEEKEIIEVPVEPSKKEEVEDKKEETEEISLIEAMKGVKESTESKEEKIEPVIEKPVPAAKPLKNEDQPEETVTELIKEFQRIKEAREAQEANKTTGGMKL